MSRYKVDGPWGGEGRNGSFYVQSAPIVDTKNGQRYEQGAWRVVDARNDMKPAVKGKGGTVPFYGETAWMHATSLCRDLAFKEMRDAS